MKHLLITSSLIAVIAVPGSLGCDSCFGPTNHVEHVRHVKRMQPGAPNATYGPTRALEWGQLNFLHTTDTHGWLEGHLKEENYGADWGDFVSFSNQLKRHAAKLGSDLLVVDTGDLHDGAGLSDATTVDGEISLKIFDKINYDLLTIGNHELYLAEVANQTAKEIAAYWGDKYLTSNVQILDSDTNGWEYIGNTHKYLTTEQGLRIMAFGVLFDFTGNANTTKVIPAATMITENWFVDAVNYAEPIDLFLILGHNPARPDADGSTFGLLHDTIRKVHPRTPIQFFGGHSHIRDFAVLDSSSTSLESGRYCETLGWLSMSGFDKDNSGLGNTTLPHGVPHPTRKATSNSTSPFKYARRYLDWNRKTFEFHSQPISSTFDSPSGLSTSSEITTYREQLHLGELYGCVPQDYCMTCAPFTSSNNIFPMLSQALAETVVNENRTDTPRYIISNTGGIRFDMHKGPFTYDDNFIVSPFRDAFLYVPDVPCGLASTVLNGLNNAGASQKRGLGVVPVERDICVDPLTTGFMGLEVRDEDGHVHAHSEVTRRQVVDLTPGYTTTDDFGTDGDDTAHSEIPYYEIPDFFQGEGGFGEDGCTDVVDLVFVDFIESDVLAILGSGYSDSDVDYYVSANFTTQDYLAEFVKASDLFQAGLPNCTIA
ncbi:Metallo-dependent phosphatase-like protein [Pseudomassariella vexata]|uniref:Metallo-dependent phosphatase-like protein n=1 Tax=Pseudomassariella vexata TaxID=1141098 RepID=A0A1Y2ED66_9PEZI|nr:Metallo-dependent phosphatase-like protein [Pseudomassariella vexata]ORY69519.1 Metallo-dependent phosphatase-like protein [Pseudomassariella vexata]